MPVFSSTGPLSRSRRLARVQAPVAPRAQMDHPALLPFQGRLGLAHPDPGDVHGHLHALRRRVRPGDGERPGERAEQVRGPHRHRGSHR